MVWHPEALVEERTDAIAHWLDARFRQRTRSYIAILIALFIVLAVTVAGFVAGFWIYHARVAQAYQAVEPPKGRVLPAREFSVVEEKALEEGTSRRWRITLIREEPSRWRPTVEERRKLILLKKGSSYRLRTGEGPEGLLENSYAALRTPQRKSASTRLPLKGLTAGIPILPSDDTLLFLRWTPDPKSTTEYAMVVLEELEIPGDEYRRLLLDRSIAVQNVLFPDP